MNETISTLLSRRSIRNYTAEQVSDENLKAILEAAVYAPSAVNQQSWHFTVIQNKEVLDNMAADLKDSFKKSNNPRFQQLGTNENFSPFHRAPTVIVISGDEKAVAPEADCAAAAQNILLAAESLGLGACWVNMTIFLLNSEKGALWKKNLGIPEGYKPLYSITLGNKGTANPKAAPRKENSINYIK
ncbi:nitroreductase family protein [Oxobacter pfennigii]|nr:nitroreductase family protein [Oxobacter pfennigii]